MIRDEIGFILNPKFAYLFQNNLKVAGWPRNIFTNSVTDARKNCHATLFACLRGLLQYDTKCDSIGSGLRSVSSGENVLGVLPEPVNPEPACTVMCQISGSMSSLMR